MSLFIKKALRHSTVASVLLTGPLFAIAGGYEAPTPKPTPVVDRPAGVYMGLQAGMGIIDGQYRTRQTLTQSNFLLNSLGSGTTESVIGQWKTSFGGSSALLGAAFGIDTVFNNSMYTALELSALYNSYSRSMLSFKDPTFEAPLSGEIRVKNNFLWGLNAKIGKDMGGYTPYFLVGFEGGRWRVSGEATAALAGSVIIPVLPTTDATLSAYRHSYSKTRYAPTIGAGVRFKIIENWQGDLQYRYSWYGALNDKQVHNTLEDGIVIGTNRIHSKVKPNHGKAVFSINYYFDSL